MFAGVPVPMTERRIATYWQAFLGEYIRWLDDTEMLPDDKQDYVDTMQSAMRQLLELHKEMTGKRGLQTLGEVLDRVVPVILAKSGVTEVRQ
jgi:hypothetical protein